jgi:hypothetical protein
MQPILYVFQRKMLIPQYFETKLSKPHLSEKLLTSEESISFSQLLPRTTVTISLRSNLILYRAQFPFVSVLGLGYHRGRLVGSIFRTKKKSKNNCASETQRQTKFWSF